MRCGGVLVIYQKIASRAGAHARASVMDDSSIKNFGSPYPAPDQRGDSQRILDADWRAENLFKDSHKEAADG